MEPILEPAEDEAEVLPEDTSESICNGSIVDGEDDDDYNEDDETLSIKRDTIGKLKNRLGKNKQRLSNKKTPGMLNLEKFSKLGNGSTDKKKVVLIESVTHEEEEVDDNLKNRKVLLSKEPSPLASDIRSINTVKQVTIESDIKYGKVSDPKTDEPNNVSIDTKTNRVAVVKNEKVGKVKSMLGKGKNTSVKQTLPVILDVDKSEKAEILKAREKTSQDTEIKDKSDENKSKMMRTKTVGEQNLLKGHGIKNSVSHVEEDFINQKTDVIKILKSEESRKNQKENVKTVLNKKEDTKTTNQNNKEDTKTTNHSNKENTKTTNQNDKESTKSTNQSNKEDTKTTNQNNKENTKTTNQNNKADKEVEKSKDVVKTISNDKDNSKTIRKQEKLSLTSRNEDNKIDIDNHDKVAQKMKTKNEIDSKTINNKIVDKQTMKTNSLNRKSGHNEKTDVKKESRDLSDIRKDISLPKSINTNTREQKKESFSIATTTVSDHWTLIAAGEEMHFKKEEMKERNKILLVEIEKEPCENVSSFENWVLVARGNVPIRQTSLHQANDMWIPTAQGSDIINGGIIQLDKLDIWSKEIKEDLGKSRKPGNYGTIGPYDNTKMEFFHYNMRNEWDIIQMPIQHCEFVRELQDYSLSTSEQIQLYFRKLQELETNYKDDIIGKTNHATYLINHDEDELYGLRSRVKNMLLR